MTDLTATTMLEEATVGRSLWGDAWARLLEPSISVRARGPSRTSVLFMAFASASALAAYYLLQF